MVGIQYFTIAELCRNNICKEIFVNNIWKQYFTCFQPKKSNPSLSARNINFHIHLDRTENIHPSKKWVGIGRKYFCSFTFLVNLLLGWAGWCLLKLFFYVPASHRSIVRRLSVKLLRLRLDIVSVIFNIVNIMTLSACIFMILRKYLF